jgi:hypothetical protein
MDFKESCLFRELEAVIGRAELFCMREGNDFQINVFTFMIALDK